MSKLNIIVYNTNNVYKFIIKKYIYFNLFYLSTLKNIWYLQPQLLYYNNIIIYFKRHGHVSYIYIYINNSSISLIIKILFLYHFIILYIGLWLILKNSIN